MAAINPSGFPVERGKIHEFANSILDDNPHYHDEAAAQADGLATVVAPPTYASVASYFLTGEGPSGMSGLDMRYVLHGGSEWTFERPIMVGDVLTGEPGETSSYEKTGKRGGTMKFIDSETIYKDQNGDVVMRLKSTLIQTAGVVS